MEFCDVRLVTGNVLWDGIGGGFNFEEKYIPPFDPHTSVPIPVPDPLFGSCFILS
jgi:hypothetical protein